MAAARKLFKVKMMQQLLIRNHATVIQDTLTLAYMTIKVVECMRCGAVHHVPMITHHKLLIEEGIVGTQVGVLPLQSVTHVVNLSTCSAEVRHAANCLCKGLFIP